MPTIYHRANSEMGARCALPTLSLPPVRPVANDPERRSEACVLRAIQVDLPCRQL